MKLFKRKNAYRFADLAQYNAEVARGIMHTPEWKAKMAQEQRRFNLETNFGDADPYPGKIYVRPQP